MMETLIAVAALALFWGMLYGAAVWRDWRRRMRYRAAFAEAILRYKAHRDLWYKDMYTWNH